ncbi:MAG: carboxypeptidase regulatory-like domain-containing protein [Myxococcales bacterium]|nr:carboxypeptidase regulatory-like domain-containing protein [Myxococcales bacterium]
MRAKIIRLAALFAALGCFLASPALAAADASVFVLGLRSIEGDDDFARNLTTTIREAADGIEGWEVSPNDISLTQMSLAHGCDEPDAICLSSIASDLGAQRLVYGSVRRTGAGDSFDFSLTLYLFNAETQQIEESLSETIPSGTTRIADLRPHAARFLAELSGQPQTGSVRILASQPGSTVRIDDDEATTDEQGVFVAPTVPVGRHRIEVEAEGYEVFRGSVTVSAGEEASLEAHLVEAGGGDAIGDAPPGAGPGEGGRPMPWLAIASYGAAAILFGLTAWSWSTIDGLDENADYHSYRLRVPTTRADVCAELDQGLAYGAPASEFAGAQDVCSRAGTLEVLQWVFLAGSVVSAGLGTYFLIDYLGEAEDDSSAPTLSRLRLAPSFSSNGGFLSATVDF